MPEGALLLHLWIYLSFRPGSLNPLNPHLSPFSSDSINFRYLPTVMSLIPSSSAILTLLHQALCSASSFPVSIGFFFPPWGFSVSFFPVGGGY